MFYAITNKYRREREKIKRHEVEPFLKSIAETTFRYLQPRIPRFIRGSTRDELTEIMVKSLPSSAVIYKGMPSDRDLTIMSEAALIYRKYEGKEQVYLASVDNHFKPNPIQIGSFLSPGVKYTGELDSTIRDRLAEKFGFIGEDPQILSEIMKKEC